MKSHLLALSVRNRFAQSITLKKHLLIHTGEKPHKCTLCGEKPHTCTVCDHSFTLSSTLKNHMLIHTDEKPHECSFCEKSFAQNHMLNYNTFWWKAIFLHCLWEIFHRVRYLEEVKATQVHFMGQIAVRNKCSYDLSTIFIKNEKILGPFFPCTLKFIVIAQYLIKCSPYCFLISQMPRSASTKNTTLNPRSNASPCPFVDDFLELLVPDEDSFMGFADLYMAYRGMLQKNGPPRRHFRHRKKVRHGLEEVNIEKGSTSWKEGLLLCC